MHGNSKVLPYSLPNTDPGEQAFCLHVTFSVIPSGELPLLSVRLAVTFPAKDLLIASPTPYRYATAPPSVHE